MEHTNKIVIVMLLLVLMSGCKEPYSSEVNSNFEFVRLSKCMSSGNCQGECLICPNEKMVVSDGYQENPSIVIGLDNRGVCIPEGYKGGGLNQFKTGSRMPKTAFCLIDIDGKEIPVLDGESIRWVDLWKEFVLDSQNISEEYFKNHISIESIDVEESRQNKFFSIKYDINIDWITISAKDKILIKMGNESDYLSKDAIYSISENEGGLKDRIFLNNELGRNIKLKEFGEIITRNRARSILKKCHRSIKATADNIVFLTSEGRLVIKDKGTVDYDQNHCKFAEVDLENEKLLECRDQPCYLT